MTLKAGQKAPDFTLKDQNKSEVTLSSFVPKTNVVIVFYPFTFTPVCEGEMCALRDDMKALESLDAQVLAISCDSLFAHKKWAEENSLDFPILADFWPHGEVAKAYGVFNEDLGAASRGTFIVDKEGIIRFTVLNALPDARTIEDYKKALADL